MDSETKAKLGGLLRTMLAFVGGLAISKKWIDQEQLNTVIEVAIGVVLPVGVAVWSWWQKKHQTKVVEAAIAAPPGATVEQVVAEVKAESKGGELK